MHNESRAEYQRPRQTLDDMSGEDYIDSRDVIARLTELTDLITDGEELSSEESEERDALIELCEEGADYFPDWQYGETLIRDSAFIGYAQELADDIGAIDSDASWPLSYINWEAAADALRMDYTAIQVGGYTYYGRS